MQIAYHPSSIYDTMMPEQFREAERTLPATEESVLIANLDWMLGKEPEDPYYWGPRIKELSERLGC